MFEAVGMRDVAEGGVQQVEASFANCGTKMG